MKRKKTNINYNINEIEYLSKLSDDELRKLYDVTVRNVEFQTIDKGIKDAMLDNLNIQKSLKLIRR